MERIRQWHEQNNFKRMAMRVLALIMALNMLLVMQPAAEIGGIVNAAGAEQDINYLISQLPEISDPMGTEYYFYNQLSDVEKVMYWEMTKATWDDPEISIGGFGEYKLEQLDSMTRRALTALISDAPEYHMLWKRYIYSDSVFEDGVYLFSLSKEGSSSEYLISKSEARIQQIVDTVGMEDDAYSRLRDLLELMSEEMDYDPYHPFYNDYDGKSFFNDCAVGCLVYDTAVCAGFSDTVKILCDELEIPCIVVGNDGHAWNFVMMDDGKWYSVDASINVPFDWGYYIVGSKSSQYTGNTNYFIGNLRNGAEGDFSFPTLNEDTYLYQGTYTAYYHDVESTFVEPSPRFVYEVNDDGETCTITAYEGTQSGDLIIPDQIDGYSVTAIRYTAFYKCDGFTGDLVIPDTVKEIGQCAFMACEGLSGNLILSNNLEIIGNHAFLGNKLMKGTLDFPDTLLTIGRCAFYKCSSLSGDIILPEGVTLGDEIFYGCTGMTGTLYIPDSMVWEENIIPGSGITKIQVNESNENYASHDGMLFTKDMKTLLACPSGKTGDLVIPEGVEKIARIACYYCNNLTGTLILPESLKTIEEFAFQETKLTGDLIFPDSVETIGEWSFSGTDFDGELTLPASLTKIDEGVFCGAEFVGDLVIPDGVTRIEDAAFFGAAFNGELHLPDSIEYIGEHAICGDFTNSMELKDTNVILEEQAFFASWFSHFSCNCGVEYNMQLQVNSSEEHYNCPHCGGGYIVSHEHDFTSIVKEPNCTEGGQTINICSTCGNSYVTDEKAALGHNYESVVTKKPTCSEAGITTYTCLTCGDSYAVSNIPETQHQWVDTTPIYCSVCVETLGSSCAHNWIEATCVVPKFCIHCGVTVGKKADHSWHDATCKAPKTCSTCGTTTGKKADHVYDDKVDGTCNICGIHRESTEKRTVMDMFRMYDPNSGEHFYTGSEIERDNLVAEGWCYEGVGFTFSMTTGAPVHRLYDPVTGEHLYTMDEEEKAALLAAGWNYEGIAFNSAYDTEVPQYRLHNPNETRGAYHFTASIEERDYLLSIGWEDQGIGFYSSWK